MKKTRAQIIAIQLSHLFITGMEDRLVHGYLTYQNCQPPNKTFPSKCNALESAQQRIKNYEKDGNTEWLIDAANFLQFEFQFPSHPQGYFRSTRSDESPGYVTQAFETECRPTHLVSDADWLELQEHRKRIKKENGKS